MASGMRDTPERIETQHLVYRVEFAECGRDTLN